MIAEEAKHLLAIRFIMEAPLPRLVLQCGPSEEVERKMGCK